jgi:hypothetical protein
MQDIKVICKDNKTQKKKPWVSLKLKVRIKGESPNA